MTKVLIGAGCFWGIEEFYRKINGIVDTKVGYSGGNTINPTYEDVCTGTTEHAEVVKLSYDKNIIDYKTIIEYFWKCHDPTQMDRQGLDVGRQYRSVIFFYNEEQKIIALESKRLKQLDSEKTLTTEITPVKEFYLAEEYHQLFIKKRD